MDLSPYILSSPLATLLGEMFLDLKIRSLFFTTHWVFHPSEAFGHPESPRGYEAMFVSQTMDVGELKKMLTHQSLVPAEVALYAGFPALIYSVKNLSFDPSLRFKNMTREDEVVVADPLP